MNKKPNIKPTNPNFSSGPCAKHPGFTLEALKDAPLGRSHRSVLGKSKLYEAIEKTKEILNIPQDYLVGIVPASDTGAIEMSMWNLLGVKGIDVVHFDSFGKSWATDITKELKLDNVNEIAADYGELPDLSKVNFDNDVVFTWNGTTSGVKIPNGDFISEDRKGLTICDATSAVFAMEMPWEKLDVVTFSWQKVLGGEAGHGMLIMSPRAVQRIEEYTPNWPIPKIFKLKKDGKIAKEIFEGSTINTPSMLCNEDYLDALRWTESVGGLAGLMERSQSNFKVIENFVENHNWAEFLAKSPEIRSNTSVCLVIDLSTEKRKKMLKLMEEEKAAYDINSYKTAPEGIRVWCGATVEKEDLEIMLQWLEWAYNQVK
jgi:phosphoserine aminotransferase